MVNITLTLTDGYQSEAQFGASIEQNGVHLFGGETPLVGFENWGSVQLRMDRCKVTLTGRASDFEAFAEQIMEVATSLQEMIVKRNSVPLSLES